MAEHDVVYGPPAPLPQIRPGNTLHRVAMRVALWGPTSWASSWVPGLYLSQRPDMAERYRQWQEAGEAQRLGLMGERRRAAREREERDAHEAAALGISIADLRDRRELAFLATLPPEERELLKRSRRPFRK